MEGKRIGIVVGGAGAIPEPAIRMAQEHDVELVRVEDIKQKSSTVSPPLVMKLNSVGRWNLSRCVTISSATRSHTASALIICGSIKPTEEID